MKNLIKITIKLLNCYTNFKTAVETRRNLLKPSQTINEKFRFCGGGQETFDSPSTFLDNLVRVRETSAWNRSQETRRQGFQKWTHLLKTEQTVNCKSLA